jgi:hypothetical protein
MPLSEIDRAIRRIIERTIQQTKQAIICSDILIHGNYDEPSN